MRTFIYSILALAFITACSGGVETVKTGAGGQIFAINDSSVPLVNFEIVIRGASSLNDPQGKEGLASITSTLLEKGTASFPKTEFESAIDAIGADIDTGTNNDGTSISGTFINDHYVRYFTLLKSLLTEPLFDENELKLEIERRKNQIENTLKSDNSLLQYYIFKEWYAGHPNSRSGFGTISSLNKISIEDVKWFFNRFYAEQTVLAGISGDIADGVVISSLRKTIESLKVKNAEIPKIEKFPYQKGKKLYIIDKPNRSESKTAIIFNTNDLNVQSEQLLKLSLATEIFGGSDMDSRLFSELREKNGYLYYTQAYFSLHNTVGSSFVIVGNPHAEKTGLCISSILQLFSDFVTNGITQDELKLQKIFYVNKFPFKYETTNHIMQRYLGLKVQGYPSDFDSHFLSNVKSFTLTGVNAAIKKQFSASIGDYSVFIVATQKTIQKIIEKSKLDFDNIKVIPFDAMLKD